MNLGGNVVKGRGVSLLGERALHLDDGRAAGARSPEPGARRTAGVAGQGVALMQTSPAIEAVGDVS